MPIRLNILFFLLIFSIIPFFTYSQNIDDLVNLYFGEIRIGNYPAIPRQLSLSENSKSTLNALPKYLNDTLPTIRSKAYGLVHLTGNNARNATQREDAVRKLIGGSKDRNSGNAGLALDYLTTFMIHDFTTESKDSLKILFKRKGAHFDKVIRIIGFLQIKELQEEIRLLTAAGNPRQIRWAAILSLARMNDPGARQDLMSRVKKLPVNDDVIYQIFPDMIYTRNREAINYMIGVMQSDSKDCTSADAERETPIPCGYRIMEQLAPIIKDYPLEVEGSGDIKTDDYLAALASVRYWFKKHDDYEILADRY